MFRISVAKVLVSFSLVALSFSSRAQTDLVYSSMAWIEGSWVNQDSLSVETWLYDGEKFNGWVNKVVSKKDEPLALSEKKLESLALVYVDGNWNYMAITPQHKNKSISFIFEGQDKYTYSFYNSENDFPKWIIYQRVNDNTLQVILKSKKKEVKFYYYKIQPTGEIINE